jgi:hypothetical protein
MVRADDRQQQEAAARVVNLLEPERLFKAMSPGRKRKGCLSWS